MRTPCTTLCGSFTKRLEVRGECRNCAFYAAYKRLSLPLWLWRSTEGQEPLCEGFMQGAVFAAAEAQGPHAEAGTQDAPGDTGAGIFQEDRRSVAGTG